MLGCRNKDESVRVLDALASCYGARCPTAVSEQSTLCTCKNDVLKANLRGRECFSRPLPAWCAVALDYVLASLWHSVVRAKSRVRLGDSPMDDRVFAWPRHEGVEDKGELDLDDGTPSGARLVMSIRQRVAAALRRRAKVAREASIEVGRKRAPDRRGDLLEGVEDGGSHGRR